ncbi:MAG: hypothetical protein ACI9G1_006049, partial [Pirellulaceae bacterium]
MVTRRNFLASSAFTVGVTVVAPLASYAESKVNRPVV